MAVEFSKIQELLAGDAETLLSHISKTIPKENIHLPGPDFVDRIWVGFRDSCVPIGFQIVDDESRYTHDRIVGRQFPPVKSLSSKLHRRLSRRGRLHFWPLPDK